MTQREVRIAELKRRIAALDDERTAIAAEVAALEQTQILAKPFPNTVSLERMGHIVDRHSETDRKISLFREMFRGRTDVFPIRWNNAKTGKSGYAPACHNEWQRGVCEKPRVKCSACPNQAFIEVSDNLIERHLRGTTSTGAPFVMGLYPMLSDGTCYLLVADFDREDWRRDALAYVETCDLLHVPCALERSRSGNGAHAWIFFQEPVPAAAARRLGSAIITDTMERVPDIGFRSYDRFFPSQDTVPIGGFGNLIALPLQGAARRNENSVFVDRSLATCADQWGYLAGVQRMSRDSLDRIVEHASAGGRVLGVRSHWKKERTSHGFERLLDVVRSLSSLECYPPRFAWFSPIRFTCPGPNCRPASLPDWSGWQRSRIQNSTPLKPCAYRHMIRPESSHVPN
jgi:hypothetical protein